jgi:uncharacterized protein
MPDMQRQTFIRWGLLSVLLGGHAAARSAAYVDFFRAVKIDYPGEVVRLVQRGFDPNSISEDGQPALLLALREESDKVVEALLEMPQVNIEVRNDAGETPLMLAALKGNMPAMKRLFARGAQVQHPGWTALHYAATHGGMEGIEVLLAQGASLEARSPNGTTPLMMAARYGSEEATMLLLRRGASRQAKNDKGLNAVDFARLAQRTDLAKAIEQFPGQ